MGFPMAGHLAKQDTRYGLQPHVSKAEAWVKEFGGKAAKTPRGSRLGRQHRILLCRQRRRPAQRRAGR